MKAKTLDLKFKVVFAVISVVQSKFNQSPLFQFIFSDAILKGKVERDMFKCMAYNSQGIIAGGKDRYFRLFTMKNNAIAIEKVNFLYKYLYAK